MCCTQCSDSLKTNRCLVSRVNGITKDINILHGYKVDSMGKLHDAGNAEQKKRSSKCITGDAMKQEAKHIPSITSANDENSERSAMDNAVNPLVEEASDASEPQLQNTTTKESESI